MAAHRVRRGQHNSPRYGQQRRQEWGRYLGHGARLVRFCAISDRHYRSPHHDPKHQHAEEIDRRGLKGC